MVLHVSSLCLLIKCLIVIELLLDQILFLQA